MTIRLAFRSTLLLLAAGSLATPAGAQYYYGPDYGYGPPEYGRPAGPYSYNAPPPREYGREYDDDYPAPRMPRPLSARMVADRLEQMGYERVGTPRFTGTLYKVHASAGGVRQEITVDAIRGIVLNRIVIGPDHPGEPAGSRRYGGRALDTDGLGREPEVAAPRRAPPRRQAARPAPVDSGPPDAPGRPAQGGDLPSPADPRLDPSAPRASRPIEGQLGKRQARNGPAREPKETGARPFGLNPVPAPAGKPAETDRKAAQPPAPKAKPVAEARPKPDKPVRVIQGVTPLNTGESRSQLDDLPKPPQPSAPTME